MNEDGTILSFANFCTLILLLIQKHNKKASERERKKRFRRKERKDAVVAKGGKAAPCGYLAKSMIMLPFSFRPSGLNLSVENGSPLKNINLGEVVHLPPTHRRDKVARLRHA